MNEKSHRRADLFQAEADLIRRSRRCSEIGGKLDLLCRALELRPDSVPARMALALSLSDAGRDREAVSHWERILGATRDETPRGKRRFAAACRELAALLWGMGDAERARRLHQQAIRRELECSGSLSGRTLLNGVQMGAIDVSPQKASRLLRGVARDGLPRERSAAWLQLGRQAAARRDFTEAVRCLRRAVRTAGGPKARGEALGWCGCLLVQAGRLGRGARVLRRGARCLAQAGDAPGARRLRTLARRAEASGNRVSSIVERN